MKHKDRQTAERFGILDRLCEFEQSMLSTPYTRGTDLDMDLDGWYDGIRQVIIVPRYHIPSTVRDWFKARAEMILRLNAIAATYGLKRTGDPLEDYGEHLYIVYECDDTWP